MQPAARTSNTRQNKQGMKTIPFFKSELVGGTDREREREGGRENENKAWLNNNVL